MPDFWDSATQSFSSVFNAKMKEMQRRKQEEEQRKYQEDLWAQKRKYFADQEKLRKKEEREYQAGLTQQIADTKEQNRIKAVTPVAQQAAEYYAPYVQQGLMTEQDVQLQIQHIMTQSGGDSAFDTMIEAGKRFEPAKPTAPTADEKFNYVTELYFSGRGGELTSAQINVLRKALPEGMKDFPIIPPEDVTSIGQLRTYQREQKKQQETTEKMEDAKRAYKAEVTDSEGFESKPGTFDEWMRLPDQIKKYGKSYALWRKQQLQEQIGRAAGRSPAQEAGFQGLPTDRVGQQMMQIGGDIVPPATAMPQAVPTARGERQATPEQERTLQQLEAALDALEASLR